MCVPENCEQSEGTTNGVFQFINDVEGTKIVFIILIIDTPVAKMCGNPCLKVL